MLNFVFFFSLLIHLLADFSLQTHDQATFKSVSNKFLGYHVGMYSLIWLIGLLATDSITNFTVVDCFEFAVITFFAHFFTDFITSRISKGFFEKKDYHNGFLTIGFDQTFHFIQLYLTWKLFLNF